MSGFSLVELMIVVVITGVLAATAVPTFTTYIYKSRTSEAVSFLGVIKLRQEAFRSEFGTYLQCNSMVALTAFDTASNFYPVKGSSDRDDSIGWAPTGTIGTCFNTLGASPDGAVRFRYSWIAGGPAECIAGTPTPCSILNVPADHYVIAQGHADLDDDGTWVVFELSNFTRNVFVGDTSGAPNAQGWE